MRRSSQEPGDSIWGSSEPDGGPSPSPRSTPTPRPSSPSDGPGSPTSATSFNWHVGGDPTNSLTLKTTSPTLGAKGSTAPAVLLPGRQRPSGPEGSPARTSASPASGEGSSTARDRVSHSPTSPLWSDTDLPSSSSRTFRDSSQAMAVATLGDSSVRWRNSGTWGHTGYSTLVTSECRSDDGGCSSSESTLASILQASAPPRFSLSATAATGILRRASKRGRELPDGLLSALTSLATSPGDTARESTPPSTTEPSSSPEPSTISDITDGPPTPSPSPRATSSSEPSLGDPTTTGDTRTDISSVPVLLTMREGVERQIGGKNPGAKAGKGPLVRVNTSGTLDTGARATLFAGPTVRRLTPIETERLMGWPDGWTIVEGWKPSRAAKPRTTSGTGSTGTSPQHSTPTPTAPATHPSSAIARRRRPASPTASSDGSEPT